jgi:hypothetical protein
MLGPMGLRFLEINQDIWMQLSEAETNYIHFSFLICSIVSVPQETNIPDGGVNLEDETGCQWDSFMSSPIASGPDEIWRFATPRRMHHFCLKCHSYLPFQLPQPVTCYWATSYSQLSYYSTLSIRALARPKKWSSKRRTLYTPSLLVLVQEPLKRKPSVRQRMSHSCGWPQDLSTVSFITYPTEFVKTAGQLTVSNGVKVCCQSLLSLTQYL